MEMFASVMTYKVHVEEVGVSKWFTGDRFRQPYVHTITQLQSYIMYLLHSQHPFSIYSEVSQATYTNIFFQYFDIQETHSLI